ncbi:MAG: yidC [Gammaproteobacteria bacterium]|nr:yidC [Gammaproteobacteria bacterium]
MDYQKIKIFIMIALAVVVGLLWTKWQVLYDPVTPANTTTVQSSSNNNNQVPNVSINTTSSTQTPASVNNPIGSSQATEPTVSVNTGLFNIKIDLVNGGIVYAELNKYPASLNSQDPFILLNNQGDSNYLAESGLVGTNLPAQLTFKADQTSYDMGNQNQLQVNLTWSNNQGLSIIKTYTFTKNSYAVNVNYQIINKSKQPVTARFYGQLVRTQPEQPHSLLSVYRTYTGAAISTPTNHYQKVTFSDMQEQDLNLTATGGWVAMLQHYFITAWVPDQTQNNDFYSHVYNNLYGIGIANPQINAAPGQSVSTGATLYMGPAIASNLQTVAPYLDKTIDYGWLWFISQLIFSVMKFIYSFVGNWGWSIVIVTVFIKLLFSPLSAKSYRSMARMRKLQPKIQKLKERYGDDKQQLGRATMEMYREEKVNPLGGCLPMLIQIPVFIALYWVLMESVELRQAPFMLWIHDLSARDPYFILPVLMGASMFIQQKLNPAPADPTQARVMMLMPVVFTVMFLSFPSGLVLYWLVNNCVSILQQWWIIRQSEKAA